MNANVRNLKPAPLSRQTLDERIAAALGSDAASSVAISNLITEAEDAVTIAGRDHEQAKVKALDPTKPLADVAEARRAMADAEFQRERVVEANAHLAKRLVQAQAEEAEVARKALRDEILAERDALAEKLSRDYPELSLKLAILARRVAANNDRIREAFGGTAANAEAVARHAPANWLTHPSGQMPSIVHGLRLPAFRLDPHSSGYLYINHPAGF